MLYAVAGNHGWRSGFTPKLASCEKHTKNETASLRTCARKDEWNHWKETRCLVCNVIMMWTFELLEYCSDTAGAGDNCWIRYEQRILLRAPVIFKDPFLLSSAPPSQTCCLPFNYSPSAASTHGTSDVYHESSHCNCKVCPKLKPTPRTLTIISTKCWRTCAKLLGLILAIFPAKFDKLCTTLNGG